MEDDLIMHRETFEIEGGRKLYSYTFEEEIGSSGDRVIRSSTDEDVEGESVAGDGVME